ncbi:MAG TPA: TetR/AcrR family transcriptional regulator [Thermomicrobiales bacterium]|nr:TetR/AcrR family transcriptional regulator [Thermomicrobiales bacterium]
MARGADTRERILAAAREVMRGKGLVRATTKEIARAAGLSEGTLYNHFANKEELFLCTLNELPSGFVSLIRGLQERAGTEAVQSVLEQIARSALDFYGEAIPMGASFFADPELLARHRELLQQRGAGPQRANEAVAAYLRTEQGIGRVRGDADPDAVAYMLLGALYQYIYWRQFLGQQRQPEADNHFVESLLSTLDRVLTPVAS